MITFEEAFAKAKALKPNIDICTEYDQVYVFSGKDDDKSIGGYDKEPVVILKEDGSTLDITAFFDSDAIEELRQLSLGAERWRCYRQVACESVPLMSVRVRSGLISYSQENQRRTRVMKRYYITITGTEFRHGSEFMKEGMKVKLVKEPDNEYDKEAIKVTLTPIGTVGYVANSVKTVIGECVSAGRLYDKFGDEAEAEIMYVLPDGVIAFVEFEEMLVRDILK